MKSKSKTYQDNFISAVRMLMAQEDMDTIQKVAAYLGINYMALYKVMDRTNKPTTELCITLCLKAGINANWMFLNRGEKDFKKQAKLDDLVNEVAEIKNVLTGSQRLKPKTALTKKLTTG